MIYKYEKSAIREKRTICKIFITKCIDTPVLKFNYTIVEKIS